jgi:hypothetical protein
VGAEVKGGLVGIGLKSGTRGSVGTEVAFSVGLLGTEVTLLFSVCRSNGVLRCRCGRRRGAGRYWAEKVEMREAVGTEVTFSVGLLGAEVRVLFVVGADVEGAALDIRLKVGTRGLAGAEVALVSVGPLGTLVAAFGVLVGDEVEGRELGIEVPVPWPILGFSVEGAIGSAETVEGYLVSKTL